MADYTVSSGNVFKDLGLPEPEEKLAKAKLAYKINCLIAAQEMTQKEAAVFLEISQYKMTQLRNGRLNSFTVDYLVSLLEKLESCTTESTVVLKKSIMSIPNPDSYERALKHFDTKKDAVILWAAG